jgi:putative pyoverdin transport system ATP-binding/permease protein
MFSILRFYCWQSGRNLSLGLASGLVSGVLTTCLIAIINSWVNGQNVVSVSSLLLFLTICTGRLLFGIFSHRLLIRLSQGAICNLRLLLCRQILESPLNQLERIGSGKMIGVLTEDVSRIAEVVVNIPYFFINIVVLAACLVYLLGISAPVFGITLVSMAVGVATYLWPVYKANQYLRHARQDESVLFRYMNDVIEGAKELKQGKIKRDAFLSSLLEPAAEAVRDKQIRGISIYATAANWNRTLFFFYVAILVICGQWLLGSSLKDLAVYTLILLYMMAPLEAVMNVLPLLARAGVAVDNAQSMGLLLQKGATEQTARQNGEPLLPLSEPITVSLEDVTYNYRADDGNHSFSLGKLNMTLRPGEITFMTGANGSGKTTLAKLVCGLYAPASGTIHVNGVLISEDNREAYRHLFAAVFSEFHLFDRLVGVPENCLARAGDYLRMLELDKKVRINDAAWSTLALSRGQRKRLALLLALIADTPVLVFDEWAADQDPYFKRIFYEEILPGIKSQGKTIFVITHDEHYFRCADRLLQLDESRILENQLVQ